MGTWIKETDEAIYLMDGGYWIDRIPKSPSVTNPKERVLDLSALETWLTRADAPTAMVFSIGTGYSEPPPAPAQPLPPTKSNTSINADGLRIVKDFEGLELRAYQDSVGVWTIGYGHTSMAGQPDVYPGMTITEAEAERILQRDLNLFEQGVEDALTINTNSDQFSAMVSFSFNVGLGAYRDSTLLRKHNAGDFAGAANEFLRWVFAGGQRLAGLERRRDAERALYLSQDYTRFL
ncbi:lysozyme [Oscillatoria sp. CS-180]|uniref:lysozyme n=1 Tax=Oscillatoria sp. CS-180 TaxID=3021720 RepID=UPI00232B77A9|nr:lysozyme [Oscillatoria sp. CS-180]MDB9525987.1 lysozyme [Oscillatoria sp. CS-180]